MNKRLAIFLACLVTLASCDSDEKRYWHVRYVPTTPEEQKAVAEQVAAIMASAPDRVAGDSQGWEQAIEAATQSAKESLCRPTLWESRSFGRYTGQWKYLETTPAAAK